ncbi:MAG: glycosyltransferase family 4 protein [Dehalococcoidales bacterium]|nr:glycosyltransferase family 4 protein [Dehalococcoidales bacterium]
MKIALVSPYDFAHPGGVGRHISSLYGHFVRLGHDVRVIAPTSRPVGDFGDQFIKIGRPFPIPASDSIIRVSLSLHLAPTIKEVLAREKFDVVHLHEPFMPMLCSAVLRFSDTINVGTFHAASGKPGYNFGKPISSWMLHRRARKLHGHIAVSKAAEAYAKSYVPTDYNIIPNGIDLKHFRPEVAEMEQFKDGKLNIVFMGRLEPRKGLNYLLKAFYLVKKEMPNTRLIVCGPGTRLRKRYENWVKDNRLQDVVFTGMVSFEDQPRYYRTADVFCAPNTGHESFGLILLEAMATGRPVVGTNIEGFTYVVNQGSDGLLVPPMDSHALAQSLLVLLNDKKKREEMGKNAILTAQKYDWEQVSQRVLSFYQTTTEKVRRQRLEAGK